MRTGEQSQRWAPGDVVIGTVTGSGYRVFTVLAIITFAAKAARISTFSTSAKLYSCETILGWPSHNYHCPCALRWSSRDDRDRAGW